MRHFAMGQEIAALAYDQLLELLTQDECALRRFS